MSTMHNKKTHTMSLVFAMLASAIFGMSFMAPLNNFLGDNPSVSLALDSSPYTGEPLVRMPFSLPCPP